MDIKAPCPHCRKPNKLRAGVTNPFSCPHCRREIHYDTMGHFWLLEELGAGGFGQVFRAYDPNLDREVAIKVLHEQAATEEGYSRFEREAKLTAKIDHANVAAVYDYGRQKDKIFLVSRLIKGRELRHYISERGFPDIRQAVAYGITLLETLHDVHENYETVHRDVKPSNIIISDRGEVFLLDFGIAASRDPDLPQLTREGFPMGTPYYMPPEQIRMKRDDVGPKADQYSLGVVIYQMLTGRVPFEAEEIIDVFQKILKDEPTPPSRYRPHLDPKLERIVMRSLSKSPAKRYATCREFADALHSWLGDRPTAIGGRTLSMTGVEEGKGGNSGLMIVLAVVSVLLLALAGFLIFGGKSSSSSLPDLNGPANKSSYQPK